MKTNVDVILLSGWAGSGKDTCADYLVRYHGYRRLGIADVLKDRVSEQYGIPRSWLDDRATKETALLQYPVIVSDKFTMRINNLMAAAGNFALVDGQYYYTPRALCILEGSTKRAVDPTYWVRAVAEEIEKQPWGIFVISDLRYRTEVDTLKVAHPLVRTVRVTRHEAPPSQDASERDLDDYTFDDTIDNTGDLEDLYAGIERMLREYT